MIRNILEYLEDTVRQVPEKLAFADGTRHLTFRQTYDQARAIGSFLLHRGLEGRAVAVLMEKQPRSIAAFLGAIYAGGFYVPLDPEMPRSRITRILDQLEPGCLICDGETETLARELAENVFCYQEAAFGVIEEQALARVRQKQLDIDPVYVVFTSGSTGMPKGVVGCHRSVIDYIEQLVSVLDFRRDTVFGCQSPLYVDACLKEILGTLKCGATTYLIPRGLFRVPLRLIDFLNEYRINTLCWVVSALSMLSSLGALEKCKPRFVGTVAFASEVFPTSQLNIWRKALPGCRFFNLYGPTETTGICCCYRVERAFSPEEQIPIGKPLPNTQILLLDEQGNFGNRGEICIRGTRLTLGYYRDPEATAERFVINPQNPVCQERIYRTGDLGAYNDRGELVFLGRMDHQIKHMGYRIELGEIEGEALRNARVHSACCTCREGKLVLHYTGSAAPEELAAYLKDRLPRYMLPGALRQRQTLPMTPNGKIDRKQLQEETT